MKEIDALRHQFRVCFNGASCNVSECFPAETVHKHDPTFTPYLIKDEIDLKDYFFTSYIFRSIYDDQVERWLNVFPREQSLYKKL